MADPSTHDWLNTRLGSLLAWGLPIGAMLLAVPLADGPKTAIWVIALAWMGVACLRNARRCGRAHCRYTGPFLLAMTLPVLAYGVGALPLGSDGWRWLGLTIGVGATGIWWLSERILGRYR
ncbi:MAG: hypothetical protein ABJN39_02420 [Sulfitobacter sp.]|jgi:hypothetical protein|uniref:hypothetical protein n=1 Tax=Alphaproteobacteria TaxID=28211 RepID=UPI002942158D|nr:hypothetical protein [Sulfitobacter sp. LC.270.F.C4]WOI13305.1 hypothetical protein R1T45_01310 [Sulfitobacter sp. LC.270.F.C4]